MANRPNKISLEEVGGLLVDLIARPATPVTSTVRVKPGFVRWGDRTVKYGSFGGVDVVINLNTGLEIQREVSGPATTLITNSFYHVLISANRNGGFTTHVRAGAGFASAAAALSSVGGTSAYILQGETPRARLDSSPIAVVICKAISTTTVQGPVTELDIIDLRGTDRSAGELVKDLGANNTALGRWFRIARIQNTNPITADERAMFQGSIAVARDYTEPSDNHATARFSFGVGPTLVLQPTFVVDGYGFSFPVPRNADISRPRVIIVDTQPAHPDGPGWNEVWFFQGKYSNFATFRYDRSEQVREYWTLGSEMGIPDPTAAPLQYIVAWDSDNPASVQESFIGQGRIIHGNNQGTFLVEDFGTAGPVGSVPVSDGAGGMDMVSLVSPVQAFDTVQEFIEGSVPDTFGMVFREAERGSMREVSEIPVSHELATAVYDGLPASFSVVGEAADPESVFFKPDGTKMYVAGVTTNRIYRYTLPTPWDVSMAVYDGLPASFSTVGEELNPLSVFFKPDGTKMYVSGNSSSRVHRYNLLTPWNVSTAVYDGLGDSLLVAAQDAVPAEVYIRSDGVKMYVLGQSNMRVYRYTLGTPWNVSTAVYDGLGASLDVSAQEATPRGMTFRADGWRVYVSGVNPSSRVHQYSLSVPWDISTATATFDFSMVVGGAELPAGIAFKPDGLRLFVIGNGASRVHSYTLTGSPVLLASKTAVSGKFVWVGGASENVGAAQEVVLARGLVDDLVTSFEAVPVSALALDSADVQEIAGFWDPAADKEGVVAFFWDKTRVAASRRVVLVYEDGVAPAWTYVMPPLLEGVVRAVPVPGSFVAVMSGDGVFTFLDWAAGTARVVTNAGFTHDLARHNDFAIEKVGDDATTEYYVLFVVGNGASQQAYARYLNVDKSSGDVSIGVGFGFGNAGIARGLTSVCFDGKRYVASGDATNAWRVVYFPSLRDRDTGNPLDVEGFDIVGALVVERDGAISYWVGGQDASAFGVFFKPDGTRMFVSGDVGNGVYQYDLDVPWDIRTATYNGVFVTVPTFNITTVNSVWLGNAGVRVFVSGWQTSGTRGRVFVFGLPTPWDLTGAVGLFGQGTTAPSTMAAPGFLGVAVSNDGLRVMVVSNSTPVDNSVRTFLLDAPWGFGAGHTFSVADFSVAAQSTNPSGLIFKDDGFRMYILDSVTRVVFQYDLGTLFNVSTAVYNGVSFSAAAQATTMADIFISDDGLRMHLTSTLSDRIYQYDLRVAWDVSTAVYGVVSLLNAERVSSDGVYMALGLGGGVLLAPVTSEPSDVLGRGTVAMSEQARYAIDWNGQDVLAVAKLPSSAVVEFTTPAAANGDFTIMMRDGVSVGTSGSAIGIGSSPSEAAALFAAAVNASGTRWIAEAYFTEVRVYSRDTYVHVASALVGFFNSAGLVFLLTEGAVDEARSVRFDGGLRPRMFVRPETNGPRIWPKAAEPFQLSPASLPLPQSGGEMVGDAVFANEKGVKGRTAAGVVGSLAKVNVAGETEVGDYSRPARVKTSGPVIIDPYGGIPFALDLPILADRDEAIAGTSLTRYMSPQRTVDLVANERVIGTPFDISMAAVQGAGYNPAEGANVLGCWVNPTKTRGYLVMNNTVTVYQYDIDANGGWSYALNSFTGGGPGSGLRDLVFSPDESIMWWLETHPVAANVIRQYTVIPGDVSSAVANGTSLIPPSSIGMAITDNGAHIYILVGTNPTTILQYDPVTPFDVTVKNLVGSIAVPDVGVTTTSRGAIYVSPDGMRLIALTTNNGNLLLQYSFGTGTPYIATTLAYDGIAVDIETDAGFGTDEGSPEDMHVTPDGVTLYFCGEQEDSVYTVTLSRTYTGRVVSWFAGFTVTSDAVAISYGVKTGPERPVVNTRTDNAFVAQHTNFQVLRVSIGIYHLRLPAGLTWDDVTLMQINATTTSTMIRRVYALNTTDLYVSTQDNLGAAADSAISYEFGLVR